MRNLDHMGMVGRIKYISCGPHDFKRRFFPHGFRSREDFFKRTYHIWVCQTLGKWVFRVLTISESARL